MSNEIQQSVKGDGTIIQVEQTHSDAEFNMLASGGKFLPRLQMYGGNSEMVKSGKIPMAHYGLVRGKEDVQDLGNEVDCLPISWRPKAMDVSSDDVVAIFDPKDPEFKRIQDQSEVKDSGCMVGPEFLVWIPGLQLFATLYMQSKTNRREAPSIRERLGKPTTLAVQYIKTAKYSWHGIITKPCSTPFELPDDEALVEVTQSFLNPPKDNTEQAPESAAPNRAR